MRPQEGKPHSKRSCFFFFYGTIAPAPGIHLNKPALKTQTSWQKTCLSPPGWQPPYSL